MKVKLLKDHLDLKKGQIIEVTPERADYFQLVGVALKTGNKAKKKAAKKSVNTKTKRK